MKVPFVHGPGDLRIDDVARPIMGPRDIVMRPVAVGICGSDVGYVAAGGIGAPSDTPVPLGHELAGTIGRVGAEVTDYAVGDRVVVNPYHNLIGNGGPEGGFADQLLIRDVIGQPGSLVALPASMSFETGALVEPLAVAMHAVNRSEAQPGSRIALFGAGPIGLAMVALMRHRGIDDVVVFEPSPLRRDRALKLGARAAIDPKVQEPLVVLVEHHGTAVAYGMSLAGTDIFIDAAGAAGVADSIIGMAKVGASIIVVAVQKEWAAVPLQLLLAKELTLKGSLGYKSEFEAALRCLENGLDLKPMITHRFPSSDIGSAFAAASRPQDAIKVVVGYANQEGEIIDG